MFYNLNKKFFSNLKDNNLDDVIVFGLDDFDSEFENNFKKTNVKKLFNCWDDTIYKFIESGNSFFSLTINFYNNDNLGNDIDLYKLKQKELFEILKNKIKLMSVLFIVPELNKNNNLHFHCLLAVRNLVDYNIIFKNNLINFLKSSYSLDIKINYLSNFLDVKRWLLYIHKDIKNNSVYKSNLYFLSKFQNYFGDIFDIYSYYNIYNVSSCGFCFDEKLDNLMGCKIISNSLEKTTIIDLILYYIQINDIYIYKNNLYKKIEGSLISYEVIGDIKEILYDNFKENVVTFFHINFTIYFDKFNFYYIIKKFLKINENIIEDIIDLTTNKIKPDYSILEFTDGIYLINYDKFIHKSKLKDYKLTVSTLKYYKKTYKHLSLPKKWINDLKIALDIKNEDDIIFKQLCLYIANVFNRTINIFSKKKVLYIYGESNTRKTTLIAKPFLGYFGKENVGFLVKSKNFKFQDLVDKKVGILDEFKYESYSVQEYLKLFAGEDIMVDEKYSKTHKSIKNLPIIILSNNKITERDENLRNALLNRIYEIEFKNVYKNNNSINENIDKILKEEEANIVIYCNKIYFTENFKKNNLRYKNIIETLKLGEKN